jgi:hypothetical protein
MSLPIELAADTAELMPGGSDDRFDWRTPVVKPKLDNDPPVEKPGSVGNTAGISLRVLW